MKGKHRQIESKQHKVLPTTSQKERERETDKPENIHANTLTDEVMK